MPSLQRLSSLGETAPLPRRHDWESSKRKRDDGADNVRLGGGSCDSNTDQGGRNKRAKVEPNDGKENTLGGGNNRVKNASSNDDADDGVDQNLGKNDGCDSKSKSKSKPKQCTTKTKNAGTRTKTKKPKDPNAPKRPASSYMCFSNLMRPRLKAQGLNCSGAALGERWRALSNVEMRPYHDMAAANTARYYREMEAYRASLVAKDPHRAYSTGGDVVGGSSSANGDNDPSASIKANKKQKQKQKDPNAPKGVPGVFVFYQNVTRSEVICDNPGATLKDVSVLMGRQWKLLSEMEKRPYYDLWEEDKRRYEREMAVYGAGVRKEMKQFSAGLQQEAGQVPGGNVGAQRTNNSESPPFQSAVTVAIIPEKQGDVKMAYEKDKENQVNASAKCDDDGSIQNETTKSNNFGGLGKRIMATKNNRQSLLKNDLLMKKKKCTSPAKMSNIKASCKILAELEAMKASSVAKLPQISECKVKSNTKAGAGEVDSDKGSTASCSSCDSILEAGISFSPRKYTGEVDRNKCLNMVKGTKAKKIDSLGNNAPTADGQNERIYDGKVDKKIGADGTKKMFRDVASPAHNRVQKASSHEDSVDVDACCLSQETQQTTNTSKKQDNIDLFLLGRGIACVQSPERELTTANDENQSTRFATEVDPADKAANTITASLGTTKLRLVPISQDACGLALQKRGIKYSDPEYLVPGSEEYSVARKIITLEMIWRKGRETAGIQKNTLSSRFPTEAVLGRNKTTRIKWSAISRQLCQVFLAGEPHAGSSTPAAFLMMNKISAEHAVCLDGHDMNEPIGECVQLQDGNILSLYGPTGFAYRVEIAHCNGNPQRTVQNQK